jgi:transposase
MEASMTKLLEEGIRAVRNLSDERQDVAGELLLSIAEDSGTPYRLTDEQVEELKLAIAEADRGEFATDKEMAEFWKKCGL